MRFGNRKSRDTGNRRQETALFLEYLFIFDFYKNGKDNTYIIAVPGIHRTAGNGKGKELIRSDTAFPEDDIPQIRFRIIRRKSKIGKSKHFILPPHDATGWNRDR